MITLSDRANKQIVDFIKYAIRNTSAKDISVANKNILTSPGSPRERIEFFSYGFFAKGINTTERTYDEESGSIIVKNNPYYNFTTKIRIVSTPGRTMELASSISTALSSFDVVNYLIPDISILNEKMRSTNLMVSGDGATSTGYYMYDIDIPSVIEDSHVYNLDELVGSFDNVNVDYDIK